MNKQELIDEIAMDANLSKADAGRAIEGVIKAIVKTLHKGEQVVLVGFGTFRVRNRAARKGRNPQTGQEIQIRATKVAGFTAGKGLKDALNGVRAK
jgi:DNA-binding protein HU-beta